MGDTFDCFKWSDRKVNVCAPHHLNHAFKKKKQRRLNLAMSFKQGNFSSMKMGIFGVERHSVQEFED